jgi:hypothetical protein
MEGIDMKGTDSWAYRGVAWVGKGALLCLGLVAMLALVAVVAVLAPVMLVAAVLPTAMVRQRRGPRGRRYGGSTSKLSAPRKAVASQAQSGG